jgi:L-threonylcarbamoyladenylate synthase
VKNAGDRNDEAAIAKELYRILREFDDEDVEIIYSESFDESGIGQAIMNRLLKAAGYHIEYV